jgi:beta-glucosidase
MEFLGINYYTRSHLKFVPKPPFIEFGFKDVNGRGLTDIGWELYPEGFTQVLKDMKRYRLPIWVTENGIDDRAGTRRSEFIHQHLKALLDARADGVDVRAYLHWSLLDNFEWLEAWGPRFGLYRVDFKTLERTPTPAVDYFARIASSRQLVAP